MWIHSISDSNWVNCLWWIFGTRVWLHESVYFVTSARSFNTICCLSLLGQMNALLHGSHLYGFVYVWKVWAQVCFLKVLGSEKPFHNHCIYMASQLYRSSCGFSGCQPGGSPSHKYHTYMVSHRYGPKGGFSGCKVEHTDQWSDVILEGDPSLQYISYPNSQCVSYPNSSVEIKAVTGTDFINWLTADK